MKPISSLNWDMCLSKQINCKVLKIKVMIKTIFTLFACTAIAISSLAQSSGTITISSSLGLYIFPSNDQDAATQENDEIACYKWAKEQTGVDPINPPQIEAEQVDTNPDGTAVRGAARGAAAGAAIGAIAGDAGKGAAIGAAAGGMRGIGAKRRGDAAQQQQAEATADAQEKELMNNFNKAFSACMEGKGYTVK